MKSLTVLLLFCAQPALADDKGAAREAFREGTRYFDLGDFQTALEAFKRAYLHYEEPAFLFNIGQCQRALGDKNEALRSYRMYIRKLPPSPQRSEAQRIATDLQAAIDAEKKVQPPATPVEETETETEKPEPQPTPAPVLVMEPVAATRPSARIYKKWWLWTLVGVAAVGVGVGLGVGLRPAGNDTTLANIGPGVR